MFALLTVMVLSISGSVPPKAAPPKNPAVVELFEDDAEGLLGQMTNPGDGRGIAEAVAGDVFSGSKCIKVTQFQRFHPKLPGWNHAIRENPMPGEYRYLRFAWKGDKADCLMLQLHDATDWHIRYTAGANPYGWASRPVADKTPATWALVTIDLHRDFGDRTLTGMAFTIHSGAGYFDHVYLGRSIADLDRIDANGLAKKPINLTNAELDRYWLELASMDASVRYRTFWTLIASRGSSADYLKKKLTLVERSDVELKQIREWVRQLDSGVFSIRAKASAEIKARLEAALPILEAELPRATSAEMRQRIEALIALAPRRDADHLRRQLATRVIEFQP